MIRFNKLPACGRYYQQPSLINAVGMIPAFLNEDDPRSAVEQLHYNYAHGGGWRKFDGFLLNGSPYPSIQYPGDPALPPLAFATLRNETIIVYPYAWVMVLQPDGSHEIARMD